MPERARPPGGSYQASTEVPDELRSSVSVLQIARVVRRSVSTGEVGQQQQITLIRRAHLLELISFAGGETDRSGGMIQVFRTRPPMCSDDAAIAQWKVEAEGEFGVPSRTFSIASMKQGKGEANPEIFPGDVIVVLKAAPVYIIGEVVKPGELSIPEDGLPLTQALAMASGITRAARRRSIRSSVERSGSPQPEVIAVNFKAIQKGQQKDFVLLPFDIIEVDSDTEEVHGLPARVRDRTSEPNSHYVLDSSLVEPVDHLLVLLIDHPTLDLQRRGQFPAFDSQFIFQQCDFFYCFKPCQACCTRRDLPFDQIDDLRGSSNNLAGVLRSRVLCAWRTIRASRSSARSAQRQTFSRCRRARPG